VFDVLYMKRSYISTDRHEASRGLFATVELLAGLLHVAVVYIQANNAEHDYHSAMQTTVYSIGLHAYQIDERVNMNGF